MAGSESIKAEGKCTEVDLEILSSQSADDLRA